MKKIIFILLSIFCLNLVSCTTGNLESGGTFKVTASTGTTKIMQLITSGALANNQFWVTCDETTDIIRMNSYGYVDAGRCKFGCNINKPIKIDYEYKCSPNDYYNGISNSVYFSTWLLESSTTVKTTSIKFNRFNNPGRITAKFMNYDNDGNVISKGELDYVIEVIVK